MAEKQLRDHAEATPRLALGRLEVSSRSPPCSFRQAANDRLVAHYAPGSTAIVRVDAGPSPALPRLRALLDEPQGDATFAYATIADKGLVILRLGDGVGWVTGEAGWLTAAA